MYVSYNHSIIRILLNGRRKENGGWIPSVWDFNRKVKEVHQAALHQQCPFAAGHIYKIEKAVDELRESIKLDTATLVEINKDVVIHMTSTEEVKYNVNGYLRISCMLAEAICKYGDLLHELDRRWSIGLNRKWQLNEIRKKHETKIRRIKQQPFHYVNHGMSRAKYQDSLEWRISVKALGHEPLIKLYWPKYLSVHAKGVKTSS